MNKRTIKTTLEKGFFQDSPMNKALFHEVLMDELDALEDSLTHDNDEALVAIVVEGTQMAMMLIDNTGAIYRNENARQRLKTLWQNAYQHNITQLMPLFTEHISQGMLAVTGLKFTAPPDA